MCVGGGGSVQAQPVYRDTSEDPIVSKYPLTEAQKKENERRRKKKLLKTAKTLLGTQGDGGGDGDNGGGGTSAGGGYGSVGDASGGMAQV